LVKVQVGGTVALPSVTRPRASDAVKVLGQRQLRGDAGDHREYGKVGRFEVRNLVERPPRGSLGDAETGASGTSSGTSTVSSVPRPGDELSTAVPPRSCARLRITSMPTPRPDTEVTAAAVENPG
jgi:hypothetical protein